MTLKTKKFALRNPRRSDIDKLWENYNDKEIAKNMVTMETEKEFKKETLIKCFRDYNKVRK